jgi:hypothetical protein
MMWCSKHLGFEVITFRSLDEDDHEPFKVVAMSFGCSPKDITLHAHDIIRQGVGRGDGNA